MRGWLRDFDALLRGDKTDVSLLAKGTEHLRAGRLLVVSVMLGVFYGLFMGLYAVMTRTPPCHMQLLASAVKVPALFLLTLIVTFPSLYVFSALLGARLGPFPCFRVLVSAVAVNLAILASLGTVLGFFTISTTSYAFMKLLNVLFFGLSGVLALGFLLKTLRRIETAQALPRPEPENPAGEGPPNDGPGAAGPSAASSGGVPRAQPPDPETRRTRRLFRVWIILYALVGAQMGWVLRPFIGAPDLAFTWFRAREANIFIDILRTIGSLFGG